jgi:hypothetical protein
MFDIAWPTGWNGMAHTNDRYTLFLSFLGAGEGAISPYCMLLAIYGAGNNSYMPSGDCTFDDFLGYAGRIDYSLAANLNFFASGILAYRASNTGTPQGYFVGTWAAGVTTNQANAPGNPNLWFLNRFAPYTREVQGRFGKYRRGACGFFLGVRQV